MKSRWMQKSVQRRAAESFQPGDLAVYLNRLYMVKELLPGDQGLFLLQSASFASREPRTAIVTAPAARLARFEPTHVAATLLQAAFRAYQARCTFKERVTFLFWNEAEAHTENRALGAYRDIGTQVLNKFRKRLALDKKREAAGHAEPCGDALLPPEAAGMTRRRSSLLAVSPTTSLSDFEESIESSYKGPHISWPITREMALQLIEHFREFPNECLHRKYAFELLMAAQRYLRETIAGAVIHITIPKLADTRLLVVGDTHGQLNDVLWLFYKFGPPSRSNVYLFNGDIADRGTYATEIFFILFAFMLAEPNSVYINRGNHESADMNEVYGFAQEVRSKYGPKHYRKFQNIFHTLPLAMIIEDRVIVVHGGLCRRKGVKIEHINGVSRQRPCPANPVQYDDIIMFDLLWSDPRKEPGIGVSPRGADCICFGPDITQDFLETNNLEVCIRSHQVPPSLRGFEAGQNGRCVTLFSASNYCNTTGNWGGVIIFNPSLGFEIQEYMGPSLTEINTLYKEMETATQKVISQQHLHQIEINTRLHQRRKSRLLMTRNIQYKVVNLICEKKTELWWRFYKIAGPERKSVTVAQCREALGSLLGPELPWCFVGKLINLAPDASGLVNYDAFLARFKIEFLPKPTIAGKVTFPSLRRDWKPALLAKVYESLLFADLSLRETLMLVDRNCDGLVSLREFKEFLKRIDVDLAENQMTALLVHILKSRANPPNPDDPDADSDMLDYLQGDNEENIRIDVAEFLGRFKAAYSNSIPTPAPSVKWIEKAIKEIGHALLKDRAEIAKMHYQEMGTHAYVDHKSRRRSSAIRSVALFHTFCTLSEQGSGYVSYEDFINTIRSLPFDESSIVPTLSTNQLEQLCKHMDVSNSKKINYLEFLQAFHKSGDEGISPPPSANDMPIGTMGEEVWNQICNTIYEHQHTLKQAFMECAADDGTVTPFQMKTALNALNSVLSTYKGAITELQISLLVDLIDLDCQGKIPFDIFLQSFVPTDTLNPHLAS